jgi:hypothetical protein
MKKIVTIVSITLFILFALLYFVIYSKLPESETECKELYDYVDGIKFQGEFPKSQDTRHVLDFHLDKIFFVSDKELLNQSLSQSRSSDFDLRFLIVVMRVLDHDKAINFARENFANIKTGAVKGIVAIAIVKSGSDDHDAKSYLKSVSMDSYHGFFFIKSMWGKDFEDSFKNRIATQKKPPNTP